MVAVLRTLIVWAGALAFTACDTSVVLPLPSGACEIRKGYEFFSPQRTMKVVSYYRRCGSGRETKQMSVLRPADQPANVPGNALVEADRGPEPGSFVANVRLRWSGENALELTRNPSMPVSVAATEANGVTLTHGVDPSLEEAADQLAPSQVE